MRCGTSVWRCTGRAVILLDLAPFPLRSIWGDGSPGPLAHTRFPQSRSIDRALFRRALDILGRGPQRKIRVARESKVYVVVPSFTAPIFRRGKALLAKGQPVKFPPLFGKRKLPSLRPHTRKVCLSGPRKIPIWLPGSCRAASYDVGVLFVGDAEARKTVCFVLICPFEGGCLATQCMGAQGQ